jgi:hypothetical protein
MSSLSNVDLALGLATSYFAFEREAMKDHCDLFCFVLITASEYSMICSDLSSGRLAPGHDAKLLSPP